MRIERIAWRWRRKAYRLNIILLLLLLFIAHLSVVSPLSITVKDVECVYEYVLFDGDTVSGNFVLLDYEVFSEDYHPGVDFTVTAPGGSMMHTLNGTTGDKFEFKATESGVYKFCFHNPETTPEIISFYIHVGHIPNRQDLAKDVHLDPINVRLAELSEALESVIAEQKYLKARESRHRHTNESTRKRVIFYTIAEYIALTLLSALQVLYIRRLFSKSLAYNRI